MSRATSSAPSSRDNHPDRLLHRKFVGDRLIASILHALFTETTKSGLMKIGLSSVVSLTRFMLVLRLGHDPCAEPVNIGPMKTRTRCSRLLVRAERPAGLVRGLSRIRCTDRSGVQADACGCRSAVKPGRWRTTPDGRLAEIIVLDQFSRQLLSRIGPRPLPHDAMALTLAQEAVAGDISQLPRRCRRRCSSCCRTSMR